MCLERCPNRCSSNEVTVNAWLLLNYITPSLLSLSPCGSLTDQKERSVSSLIVCNLILYIYIIIINNN